jgi:hypothetical protein
VDTKELEALNLLHYSPVDENDCLGVFPRLLSLTGQTALGRVLVIPNIFHLRRMEATLFFGTINGTFLCLNTILSWSSTDNSFDLMAWFLL